MESKKKLKLGGKVKKKLALGSLIQDNPDDHLNPATIGKANLDYSVAKPQPYNLSTSPKLTGQINPSTAAPKAPKQNRAGAGSAGMWGAAWGAIDSATNAGLGAGTNKGDVQVSSMLNPATHGLNAMKDHDYGGAAASFLLPGLGSKLTYARNLKKERNRMQQIQSIEDTNLMNNATEPQLMRKGGKLANKLQVEGGGSLDQITPEAAKVNAPGGTDKLDIKDNKLDHKEIVDKENRVFSDDRGYAKIAEKLYKQKSKTSRFGPANDRIESKLDKLFAHQEATNPDNMETSMKSGGSIHIKPENKGKFNALKKKTGKTTEELKHSKNPLTRKRATFAANAKKWHHEDGGMITTDGNSSSLGPSAFQSNYGKQVKGKLKAKHLRTPKNGFVDGGTVESTGASATKKVKYGLAGGGWSDLATTVAPNIVNAYLQTKLKGPVAPQLVTPTRFQRVDPSAQLAELDRDTSATNELITRNTAQSSNLTSAIGASTARKTAGKNSIYGQTQQINAGIQHGEASLNQQGKMYNAASVNEYRNNVVGFGNKKLELDSGNIANLSGKLQARSSEAKQMALDEKRYKIMMEAYSALPAAMRAHYQTFNQKDWKMSKGGRLQRAISKRNTKKG